VGFFFFLGITHRNVILTNVEEYAVTYTWIIIVLNRIS